MALIICPQCGAQVSDKAEKCIHCGFVLKERPKKICEDCGAEIPEGATVCPYCGCPVPPEEKTTRISSYSQTTMNEDDVAFIQTPPQKKRINEKKLIIIGIAVILLISMGITAIIRSSFVSLNADEQIAYDDAVSMQKIMKDPSSFKLYDEMFIWKRYDDNNNLTHVYTMFEYSGTNSYGGVTRDEAIFDNGEFIMNYDDDVDASNLDNLNKVMTQYMFAALAANGGEPLRDSDEIIYIDVNKIKRKMKLS